VSGVRGQIGMSADRRRPSGRSTAHGRADEPISHAHARTLAALWQDLDRPDFALTVLARTGAIGGGAEVQLQQDLAALSRAAHLSSDPGTTICQAQIEALLTYVRVHGHRGPVAGWTTLPDDGEFVEATQAFARARRPHLSDAPAALPLTLTRHPTDPPPPSLPASDLPLAPQPSPARAGPDTRPRAANPRPLLHHALPAERTSTTPVPHGWRAQAAAAPAVPAVHDDPDDGPGADPHAVIGHIRAALADRGADPPMIDRVVSAVLELVDAVVGATTDQRDRIPARADDAGT